jgi:SAM-dependent methyltransferase
MLVCPVCTREMVRFRRDWLFRCDQCALLGSSLQPHISESSVEDEAIDEVGRAVALDGVRLENNEIILDEISKFFDRRGLSVLDVGCGHGQFLLQAIERGHEVTGIEPDADVAEAAGARTGATILAGFFPSVMEEDQAFDFVIFNDVLEHLPDPDGVLKAAGLHLRKGGLLVVNSPDSRGTFYRIAALFDALGIRGPYLRMWQFGFPSPHLWYFKDSHIGRLGARHGFGVVRKHTLFPISKNALWERISHVRTQSNLLNAIVFAGVWLAFPVLKRLPRDSFVVYLRKNDDD